MFNWTKRPLPEDALQYALGDVVHLFDLNAKLIEAVTEKKLVAQVLERFVIDRPKKVGETIPGVKKKGQYKKLHPKQRQRFDVLFETRDKLARELNKPPNNVLSNERLFQLAAIEDLEDKFGDHLTVFAKFKAELLAKLAGLR